MKATLGSPCAHLGNAGTAAALRTCMLTWRSDINTGAQIGATHGDGQSHATLSEMPNAVLRSCVLVSLRMEGEKKTKKTTKTCSPADGASGASVAICLRELKGQTSVALATDNSRSILTNNRRRKREKEKRKGITVTLRRKHGPCRARFHVAIGNCCINMERRGKIGK